MNLAAMRETGFKLTDYVYLAEALSAATGKAEEVYFGDQGLLSAAYIGNMKIYGSKEKKDVWYMPNDLCTPYFFEFGGEPDYEFNIIHFSTSQKPWKIQIPKGFDYSRDGGILNVSSGMSAFLKYVCLWWEKYNLVTEKMSQI